MDFNPKGQARPELDKESSKDSGTDEKITNEQPPANAAESPLSWVAQMVFHVSEFDNCKDSVPKACTYTWPSFCKEFGQHWRQKTKDGPAWSPASYPEGKRRRNNANVDSVSMAVIDVDDGTPHPLCRACIIVGIRPRTRQTSSV